MSSSSSTAMTAENTVNRAPTNWFAGSTGQLTKFQILFDNLKQLMSFEAGQKPIIDHRTKILSVDTGGGFFSRWWYGAFDPKFIDNICAEVLQTLKNAREPLEKSKKGDRLSKREAWTVQKAFQIAQLLISPVGEKGRSTNTLATGFANLIKTYESEKKTNTFKQLNIISMKWEAGLKEESMAVLKNRACIEKIHAIWDRVLLDGGTKEPIPSTASPKRGSSKRKRTPSALASSSNSPVIEKRPPIVLTPVQLRPTIRLPTTKPTQSTGLMEPSSSNTIFDKTVNLMRKDPHKKMIKSAHPSFLQDLKKRLSQVSVSRAHVVEEVEKLRLHRIIEVNTNSTVKANRFFNSSMLSRVINKNTSKDTVDEEIDDFFVVDEYSERVNIPPMQITRSISVAVLPTTQFKAPMRRVGSEIFEQTLIRQALEQKFQNCLNSSDGSGSGSWSDDDLPE